MRDDRPATFDEAEDIGVNPSTACPMADIVRRRLSRRNALRGLAAGAAVVALGGMTGLLAPRSARAATGASSLTFTEVAHGVDETHHVAPGYAADVLIRWGDKVLGDAAAFDPGNLAAAAQARQFGYNNDYIGYLPLPAGSGNSDHGLLVASHEFTNSELMFSGLTQKNKLDRITAAQTEVELAAHGASVVEVRKDNGRWHVVENSRYARRLTGTTPIEMAGPAAGDPRLRTGADATGRRVLGTLNNCAGGETPWGTVMIAEENFNGYFGGGAAKLPEARKYERYGISAKSWYAWWRFHDRFNLDKEPNEPNRFGWMVEFDPYDPASMPKKRTALGRFKHEGATAIVNPDGRVVVYSGDDERFDYLYKFVTNGRYNPNDRAANMDLLDSGTLYVARFSDDGAVEWLPLVHGSGPLTAENGFDGQADVLIDTRLAADLLGATPMDRPEDVEPNPVNGKVYVILTNNSKREAGKVDAANPRGPNAFGHILELVPPGPDGSRDHAALKHEWEIFLLAGDPWNPEHRARYHRAVSENGWLAAPDNCAFDPKGRLWITTDQGSGWKKTGTADGVYGCDVDGPGRALTRQLFRVPIGAEMCGPAFTPDGRTLFVAVQHPAADGIADDRNFDDPATRWPDFADGMPPRPSVVAITREDGGEIGA